MKSLELPTSEIKRTFYRRLYTAYLIDTGVNTMSGLMEHTGMSRRTLQNTITLLVHMDILAGHEGPRNSGKYFVSNWGPFKKQWIKENIQGIREALGIDQV